MYNLKDTEECLIHQSKRAAQNHVKNLNGTLASYLMDKTLEDSNILNQITAFISSDDDGI